MFEGTVTLPSVLLGLHNHFLVNEYALRAGPVGSCRGLFPSGAPSQLGKKMGRGGVERAGPRGSGGSGGSGCGWPAGGKQAEWEESCLVELLVRPGHAQVFSKLPQVWRVSGRLFKACLEMSGLKMGWPGSRRGARAASSKHWFHARHISWELTLQKVPAPRGAKVGECSGQRTLLVERPKGGANWGKAWWAGSATGSRGNGLAQQTWPRSCKVL